MDATRMDDGEFVWHMNEAARAVAHAIEAQMLTPASLERLRKALARQEQEEPPAGGTPTGRKADPPQPVNRVVPV